MDPSTTQRRAPATTTTAATPPSPGLSQTQTAAVATPSNSLIRALLKVPTILTILLRVALWPLFKALNLVFPTKEFDGVNNTASGDRAARAFVALFQQQISTVRPAIDSGDGNAEGQEHYVEPPCPFSPRGYASTLNEITSRPQSSRPLLLVYLHSPLLPGGTTFLQKYLCYPQLLRLLNSSSGDDGSGGVGSVVCFGASVHSADGEKLRDVFGVNGFPFLALVNVKSSDSNMTMDLLLRMEGSQVLTIPPGQITTYLNTTISRHAETLAEEEARRLQREEDARLREEQNREYQEALLADQMREIEQREAVERERREQEEKEEAERLKKAQEESRLEDSKLLLEKAGEPPLSQKTGVARLRFTLPNGKKVDRRFHSTSTIEVIRAFLVVYFKEQGIEMKNFGLSTNYPKKTFSEDDIKLTLEESGLAPQSVIMVQDLDS